MNYNASTKARIADMVRGIPVITGSLAATTSLLGAANTQTVDRAAGSRYDSLWREALDARAEWISIVSYNEWHEGTAIEPAQPYASGARQYLSFDGAYGTTGRAASYAYLQRTAYWVASFEAAPR